MDVPLFSKPFLYCGALRLFSVFCLINNTAMNIEMKSFAHISGDFFRINS